MSVGLFSFGCTGVYFLALASAASSLLRRLFTLLVVHLTTWNFDSISIPLTVPAAINSAFPIMIILLKVYDRVFYHIILIPNLMDNFGVRSDSFLQAIQLSLL